MNFSYPFIRRPIGTTLLAIGLFLTGAVAYSFLPVASLPSVEFPTIFVSANRPGADPNIMAATVAAPLERRLGEISGVTELTSVNSLGNTRIVVQFDLSRSIEGAARDVQAALNAALSDLPGDLPTLPRFRKANPSAAPILILALTSKTMLPSEVYDAADSVIAQRLSQVDGVGDVTVAGSEQPAIRVRVDPARIAAMGVSMEEVRTAIANSNAVGPLGTINGVKRGVTIGINDQLRNASDYDPMVVKTVDGTVVRLSNIATITPSVRNSRSAGWFNRDPSVLLIITKQANANVIDTVDRIYQLLPELRQWVPAGLDISILADRTQTIRASVHDMQLTLGATAILVMLVVALFLRRTASTVAAGITVPLSLAGTCAAMWAAGFSIDNLSLMALAVCIGFVVDDAIVMIENMFRYLEQGASPLRATLKGAKQIGFTVVSISVSLIAAFIPLLFMGGIVGRLFREFSVTLAFAIAVSTVVSLSVTPMICAYFVRAAPSHDATWLDRLVEGTLSRTLRFYDRTLAFVLEHNALALIVFRRHHRAHHRPLYQDTERLFPAGRHRADLRRHAGLDRRFVRRHGAIAAEGDGRGAGRSGGGGPRLLGRRLRLQRLGQPRPHVHQPEAAGRAAQCQHAARGGAAARQAQRHPRHPRVHGAGAGPARRRPAERFAVSVHAVEFRHRGAASLGAQGARPREGSDRRDRRHHRPRARRAAGQCQHRPAGGRAAWRAHPGHRQRAQRRLLAAADFNHLYPTQPVSRDPGSRPQIPERPERPHSCLRHRQRRHAGAVIAGGACRALDRAAGGEPSGSVPLGHHHLQSRGRRHDRGRHRGHRAGGGGDAYSRHHPYRLRRRHKGVQDLGGRAAAAAAGGAGRRLYRARRLVRKSGAPAHHHFDAAVGGLGRAARLAAVQHRAHGDRFHRHHSLDRHRQEERHHDGGLRARRRTAARAYRPRSPFTKLVSRASGRS